MRHLPRTPEQVVCEMTLRERQELLSDLGLEATPSAAVLLTQLVRQLGRLEYALEQLSGTATLRKAA